jgi:hypothetical protein
LLWAWLTLYPVSGLLPQISHTLDMGRLLAAFRIFRIL